MNAGRKQLSKMVKPFIKLKEEPSSGLEPDSRGAGRGEMGVRQEESSHSLPLVSGNLKYYFVVSPSCV